ncbi:MAG: dTDP-4-dehydrorhamnose 3,5-epimerase [Cyclobacteriaceae bacterium]|nr:dTDP-4-dehydrorhamnose 3,5-epimerase [Cyclobacteriaceae bacterium]
MKIITTGFNGLVILEPKVLGDSRGYFMESFSRKTLMEAGFDINFVQDNQSRSTQGVARGLHFQNAPYAQTKLVRVLAGSILDVVVDLRRNEPTFGKHYVIELTAENKKQILVPKGFAHGFIVLGDYAEIMYKCDEYYVPQAEGGILFTDPALGISLPVAHDQLILSDKDKKNPLLSEAKFEF